MIALIYRLVLRFYPREFRERFGAEMVQTARALDRHSRGRRWSAVRDAFVSAVAVRVDQRHDQRFAQHRTASAAMRRVTQDLRLAARGLWREPRFALFIVGTLGVAIGANAVLLGLADRLILRGPEHITDAGQVMRVYLQAQPPGRPVVNTPNMGHVLFAAIRDARPGGVVAASYALNEATIGRGSLARPLSLGYASPEFFDVLGTRPAIGRLLGARTGDAAPVVLSYELWQREFGGDPAVLGRDVVIDDAARVVVGVTPRGFTGTELGAVDAWMPIDLLNPRITPQWETAWNAQWLRTVVRLPSHAARDRIDGDLTAVLRSRYAGQSAVMKAARLYVAPLNASESGGASTDARVLAWLSGVALLVFVVACVNIMSLLLTRNDGRRREVSVRLALGASRTDVVRRSVIEAGLLAGVGTGVGLVLAAVLGEAARRLFFEGVSWTSAPVNARVVAGAAVIAVVATIATGLVPALAGHRVPLALSLRGTARDGGARRSRLRSALAMAQAAVCVVLLIGAGLFVRSLWIASTLDLGVDADRVLVVETTFAGLGAFPAGPARDAERARRRAFLHESLPSVRALPGVTAAGVAIGTPFGYRFMVPMASPGLDMPDTNVSAVSDGYFDTVGTAIVEGRAFSSADRRGTAPVAIVSAHMARQFWPGRSALGACLIVGPATGPCATIVGVAADTYRERLRESPAAQVYIPAGQESGFGGDVLLVRAEHQQSDVAEAVRRRVAELDPTVTMVRTVTLQARIDPQLRSWRLGAAVFAFAGLLALTVASAGIYSVLSYAVAAQRHEIGVRLALGATASHVRRVVVRSSLMMTLSGVVLGTGVAMFVSPRLEPLLFGVSPRDPAVIVAVAGTLVLVSLIASLTPAVRASRVDPLDVLRAD